MNAATQTNQTSSDTLLPWETDTHSFDCLNAVQATDMTEQKALIIWSTACKVAKELGGYKMYAGDEVDLLPSHPVWAYCPNTFKVATPDNTQTSASAYGCETSNDNNRLTSSFSVASILKAVDTKERQDAIARIRLSF
jgi:hypothetical protein